MASVRRLSGGESHDSRTEAFLPLATTLAFGASQGGNNFREADSNFAPGSHAVACPGQNQGAQGASSTILLAHVPCAETKWVDQAHYRSHSPEQETENSSFPDGNDSEDSEDNSWGAVGGVDRHQRRLPASPNRPGVSEVLRICARGPHLLLPGSSLRVVNSPMGLHEGHQGGEGSSPFQDGVDIFVPRRLSLVGKGSGTVEEGFSDRPTTAVGLGVQHQLGEVQFSPSASDQVPGSNPGFEEPDAFFARREGPEDECRSIQVGGARDKYQEGAGELSGSGEFLCQLSPPREIEAPTSSEVGKSSHLCGVKGPGGLSFPRIQGSPGSLDIEDISFLSCADASASAFTGDHDGCLSAGLGRDIAPSQCFGKVVSGGREELHQLVGAEGDLAHDRALRRGFAGSNCTSPGGQQHSSQLPAETRVASLRPIDGAHFPSVGALSSAPHLPDPSTSGGHSECLGGPGVPVEAHLDRVGSGSSDVSLGGRTLRSPTDRFVCHAFEFTDAELCVSVPGPCGAGMGRILPGLERVGDDISFPTSSVNTRDNLETLAVPREGSVDSAVMEECGMVSRPPSEMSVAHSASDVLPIVSDSGGEEDDSPEPLSFPASRVETIRLGLRGAGWSERVIELMISEHEASTQRQYQAVWLKFLAFLESKAIDHGAVTMDTVASFLIHHHDLGRDYRTLKGYKCAIARPLQARLGLNFDSEEFRALFKGLFKARPPRRAVRIEADWPLEQVLRHLNSALFEPLSEVSDTQVFLKTLVLVVLACGRRSSEVANMSGSVRREGDRVWLLWRPEFRAKWDSERFTPEYPSIVSLRSSDTGAELLCPVRALDMWLSRRASSACSLPLRSGFLWPYSQSRLDTLFRQLLVSACSTSGISVPHRAGMHSFRKLAASLSDRLVANSDDRARLASRMGVSSFDTLAGSYIFRAPVLSFSVVVPLGVCPPTGSSSV